MKWFKKIHIHKWTYYQGGLSRECKKCGAYDITVGDTPTFHRSMGDVWVRTIEGKF